MSDTLKLAITKVGDVLLKKKITYDFDGKAIEDVALSVPKYQRPYKWSKKNAVQLVDDILYAMQENKEVYRVGTLILHETSEDNKTSKTYHIVDGQQRTITFSLLMKVLDEGITSMGNSDNEKHTPDFLDQEISDEPSSHLNIFNNYHALKRHIKALDNAQWYQDLQAYIEENCEFVVVITNDLTQAFQFFDSQNARGKALYPHDLLKAYHLREMQQIDSTTTEQVVAAWEDIKQKELAELFGEYLYRVKEWMKDNRAWELNEHNIDKFKGVTQEASYPYAQFYKGAYAYANDFNHSSKPFVSGIYSLRPFQLDAPIIAGKAFFDYAQYYYGILKDIKDNDKYRGYYVNDNPIVKTLDLPTFKYGVGNRITRLLFDTALLLYVDRFCADKPSKKDIEIFDRFIVTAFIWAYSLRAQYQSLSWASAQNYVLGRGGVVNSFNIYKVIAEADSPKLLMSQLSGRLESIKNIKHSAILNTENKDDKDISNYLYFFEKHGYYEQVRVEQ